MSPEQAKELLEREGWTLVDLHDLVLAYVAGTSAGFDIKSARVRITVARLPLRKKPAKKKVRP